MSPPEQSSAKAKLLALKKRAAFLAVVAYGKKWVAPGLILQIAPLSQLKNLPPLDYPVLHYGLTASKKVGNAVKRNRARRRLRELARLVLVPNADRGFAYVLIAREASVTRPYPDLKQDLHTALQRLKVWRV